nr:hypothetical protein CFP56_58061 [Quercus suber]
MPSVSLSLHHAAVSLSLSRCFSTLLRRFQVSIFFVLKLSLKIFHKQACYVNNERIQKWRDALRLVANLAGWHLDRRCPEADSVKAIVEFIRNNFKSVGNNFLHTSKYLVGMESRIILEQNMLKA